MSKEVRACRRAVGGLEVSMCAAVSFALVMGCGCGFLFVASFAVMLTDEVVAFSAGLLELVGLPLSPLMQIAVFVLTASEF